jgi:hypothetical protein
MMNRSESVTEICFGTGICLFVCLFSYCHHLLKAWSNVIPIRSFPSIFPLLLIDYIVLRIYINNTT